MAKAFDLVHKVADSNEPAEESNIPFEDSDSGGDKDPAPKKKIKVEVIFFYLLLFAIFFVMGAMFLSPGLFSGNKVASTASPSASPGSTPDPGFTIDKQGESKEEANKELQPTSTPTPAASSAPAASPATATTTTNKAAKIQVLNGTTTEGKAAAFRTKLANKGIVVASIGNYHKRTVARTTIYYTADYKSAAVQVQAIVGGLLVQTTSSTTGSNDILVVVGKSS